MNPAASQGHDHLVIEELAVGIDDVRDFLLDLSNFGRWTAHQTLLQRNDGMWFERLLEDDIPVSVDEPKRGQIDFTWHVNEERLIVTFALATSGLGTRISVRLPSGLAPEQRRQAEEALRAELVLLRRELGESVAAETWRAARDHVARFHLEVFGHP